MSQSDRNNKRLTRRSVIRKSGALAGSLVAGSAAASSATTGVASARDDDCVVMNNNAVFADCQVRIEDWADLVNKVTDGACIAVTGGCSVYALAGPTVGDEVLVGKACGGAGLTCLNWEIIDRTYDTGDDKYAHYSSNRSRGDINPGDAVIMPADQESKGDWWPLW